MTSAISGKLVRGKIVYNAAQVCQILMSELSDGDDSHDDVEASDGEQSSDDGEVDVLENFSKAASDSEWEDSAEVEVDQGPTYRSKITKKLAMKILSATPKADVLQETSCTSPQNRRGMLFLTLIQRISTVSYIVTAAANN